MRPDPKAGGRKVAFCPALRGTPGERLAGFIALARACGRIVPSDAFDEPRWDVTDHVSRHVGVPSVPGRLHVNFTRGTRSTRIRSQDHDPFATVMRAYVTQLPKVGHGFLMLAVRAGLFIGEAMVRRGVTRVEAINEAVLQDAARAVAAHHHPTNVGNVVSQIRRIGAFLSKAGMLERPIAGRKGGTRKAVASCLPARSSPEAESRRARLLPGEGCLEALMEAYLRAVTVEDVVVTRVAVLLASAPSRINEVLRLDEEPEDWSSHMGAAQLWLRWPGSKGQADGMKVLAPGMMEATANALDSLRRATAEGRRIKRWYGAHPDRLYLPGHLEHLRSSPMLSMDELCSMLGIGKPGVRLWLARHGIERAKVSGAYAQDRVASFAAAERAVLAELPQRMMDAGGPGTRPLLVVPDRTFDRRYLQSPCMFQIVTRSNVARKLSPGPGSVFAVLGLDPEGKVGTMTKAFRHWLNTEALRGGLSWSDIAVWSGRADARHNASYDQRTAVEMRAAAAAVNPHSTRTSSPLARRGKEAMPGTSDAPPAAGGGYKAGRSGHAA